MKSKKHLFVALDTFFGTDKYTKNKLRTDGISDETYGRKSCIYVYMDDLQTRYELESYLQKEGFKVNRDYWAGKPISEIQVSYFKGYGWDA